MSAPLYDYDAKGLQYAARRRTDPRIAAMVHAALGDARTVLNVGAGAGSYEPLDRHVIAIEPSAAMRAQRPKELAPAIHGVAEAIPLDDQSVDASMAMITVHHWNDMARGLAEMRRVTRGPVVLLTFIGDSPNKFWLHHYSPELLAVEQRRDPSLAVIRQALGPTTLVQPVPIPIDCVDGFSEAFYARPEAMLDPAVRAAQSSWAFVEPEAVRRFERDLARDLADGTWDAKFGEFRRRKTYEGALVLVVG